MERVLESFMNSTRHDRIFKILISACKQCLPPLVTLFVLDCLVMFNTYCVVFNLIKIRSTHLLPIYSRRFLSLVCRHAATKKKPIENREQVSRSNFN